jgi:hypothetical protein
MDLRERDDRSRLASAALGLLALVVPALVSRRDTPTPANPEIEAWSKIFFGRRRLGASAVAAGAMVPLGAAYVATSARVDKPAAVQAAPYVGWLVFASVLSTTIWVLNRKP